MVNIKSIAASLFMLTGSLYGFNTFAQNANAFGATIRNPGSVLPEWWSESGYIPERLEEALHLRIGSSGNFGGNPSLGRDNCDMTMLYSAKSNMPIAPAEMEYCALLEFYLYQGVSGDKRSLKDEFIRKDTIAEFTEVVKKRIDLFRQNNTYYLRAGAVQIDPFDVKRGGMVMRLNWTQGHTPIDEKAGRPTNITYKFDELHFRKSDDRWWGDTLDG